MEDLNKLQKEEMSDFDKNMIKINFNLRVQAFMVGFTWTNTIVGIGLYCYSLTI